MFLCRLEGLSDFVAHVIDGGLSLVQLDLCLDASVCYQDRLCCLSSCISGHAGLRAACDSLFVKHHLMWDLAVGCFHVALFDAILCVSMAFPRHL